MRNPITFNNKSSIFTIMQQPVSRSHIWITLILAVLLTGCGPSQVNDQPPAPSEDSSVVANGPTTAPLPAPIPEADESESGPAANSASDTLPTPEFTAKIGKITFAADASEQHEPIKANLLFPKGITQVHALFDYSGMSTAYTWERIWYLNDKEVARKSDAWTGPESGVFDYLIDNSGKPLPPGDWVLEIHVEGKLLSLGAFVIETSEEAQANGQ